MDELDFPDLSSFDSGESSGDFLPVSTSPGDQFGFGDVSVGGMGSLLGVGTGKLIPTGATPPGGGFVRTGLVSSSSRIIGRYAGKLLPAVRVMGLPAVAAALGIGADVLAQLLVRGQIRRRRRRGISSRDVRTTRRVVRFVNRMQHDIGCVTRGRMRHARS